MPLSDVKARNAKPRSKPYKLYDSGGLFLLVQPSGGKWWRYKYHFAGKEKLVSLGTYPDVSLADARDRHAAARKALAAGNDPSQVKQETKRQVILKGKNTFEVVAREWHKQRLGDWSEDHAYKIMNSLECNIFPHLGNRPIAEIKAPELLDVLRTIEGRGAIDTVHRIKQKCGQIFMYAIATHRAEYNPAANLGGALKTPVRKNMAYLKENELPEYLQKLENYHGDTQTKLAMKFLLLTFVRTGELRGALWSEIDWDKAEWRIPASRMKMDNEHIVPLSKQAVTVLKELQLLNGQWRYVFPNEKKPGFDCMSENTVLFALYRMGYRSRATGHGMRSTASTILNEHGFAPDVIERQLAHGEPNKIRAAYNHAQYLPERRKMMAWWGDYLDNVAKGKKSDKAA